jgi:glycerophosphoryl diester phosphodiesterase
MHLMIELKREAHPDPPAQGRALAELLAPLRPGADYHLLSLDPRVFSEIPGLPRAACVPIARFDCRGAARLARREGWAGIAGHYLLVRRALVEGLHAAGLQVGTGYSQSLPALYRELNRGVDWVFSNCAARLARRLARP